MTRFKLQLVTFLISIMFCISAWAVVWTSQIGSYNQYRVTTTKTTVANGVTSSVQIFTNEYLLVSDVDSAKTNWVKQTGIFTKFKSEAGATKYVKDEVVVIPPALVLMPSAEAISCANEGATCVIPSGVTAKVWYGAVNSWVAKENVTGLIQCSNTAFGKDPLVGSGKKCVYSATSIVSPPPVVVNPPAPPNANDPCIGKFVCRTDWGWVLRPTTQQVITCVEIKILKEDALIYEAMQVTPTGQKCPVQ